MSKSFKPLNDDLLDSLRRISNGELRVRSRMIHEGAHSYILSGEALEKYERYENDVKYKTNVLRIKIRSLGKK